MPDEQTTGYFTIRGARVPVADLSTLTIGQIGETQRFAGQTFGEILAGLDGESFDVTSLAALAFASLRAAHPDDDPVEVGRIVNSLTLDDLEIEEDAEEAEADPPTQPSVQAASGGTPPSSLSVA